MTIRPNLQATEQMSKHLEKSNLQTKSYESPYQQGISLRPQVDTREIKSYVVSNR